MVDTPKRVETGEFERCFAASKAGREKNFLSEKLVMVTWESWLTQTLVCRSES